jgi:hypothetical protein
VTTPKTFTNKDVCDERTWMYSQRVSGVVTHPEACLKNLPEFMPSHKQFITSMACQKNPHWINK